MVTDASIIKVWFTKQHGVISLKTAVFVTTSGERFKAGYTAFVIYAWVAWIAHVNKDARHFRRTIP